MHLQGVKVNKQLNVYFVGTSDLALASKARGIQSFGQGKFFREQTCKLTFDVDKVQEYHLRLFTDNELYIQLNILKMEELHLY